MLQSVFCYKDSISDYDYSYTLVLSKTTLSTFVLNRGLGTAENLFHQPCKYLDVARIPIISQKTCKKLFANVPITDTQRKARDTWLEKIENKELESETTNYRWFEDIILRDLLGFPEELIRNSKDKENVAIR